MKEESFDIVVVGGGASGLAAAIEAKSAGASVLLLEKNSKLGGSTAWSVGSITSTQTPHQQRAGIVDDPQSHYDDMPLFAGELASRDNDELRRILCEEVPDAIRWLMDLGVRFYGPMPEPPHRKPRMHNVLPNSLSFIYHLERHARHVGIEIRTGARATSLLTREGAVTGIECERERHVARRAVILAAGDFTNDPELKTRFMGPREALVEGVNVSATGDGQKLALAIGARVLNGDLALGPELRFIAPSRPTLVRRLPPWPIVAQAMEWAMRYAPQRLLRPFVMSFLTTTLAPSPDLFAEGAILVNKEGKRFCNELEQHALALALADQPDKYGYIIIDGALARKFSQWPHFVSTAPGIAYAYVPDYRRNRPDVYNEAFSIAELAKRLGMEPSSLEASVSSRGTSEFSRASINEAPYVALGPMRAVFVHSEGGLAVDHQHRVLGSDDRPIDGLFAVGSTGQGGLLLKGHGHHLAWAFVSGRRAGRLATQPK